MPTSSSKSSFPYPDDHESLKRYTAEGTYLFQNGHEDAPDNAGPLIVIYKAEDTIENTHEYEVEIDFTNYGLIDNTKKPVFSLYNLGLQSWWHTVKITKIFYLRPEDGAIIDDVPEEEKAQFVQGFPEEKNWTTDFPEMEPAGRQWHQELGKDPELVGPIESKLYHIFSPEHTRLRLKVTASGRKVVGPHIPRSSPSENETSHGNVPPSIPPGSSDNNND